METAEMTMWAERVQGIPQHIPLYANDWFIGVWLLCTFLLASLLADKAGFVGNMLKTFFLPRGFSDSETRNSSVVRNRILMLLMACLTMALQATAYIVQYRADDGQGHLLLVSLFAIFLIGYLLKQGIFLLINHIFFDRFRASVWKQCYRDWLLLTGVISYLFSTLSVLLDLSARMIVVLAIITVVLAEICLLFKAFYIFCTKKYGSLQLFVYLCTLEIMPLLLAGKALVQYV